jgi:hypothetical protein
MPSTSETGHAKNVANFEDVITFCTGYGPQYDPTKPAIKLASLNTLFTDAKSALTDLNTTIPAWINAVNARELAFVLTS